MNKKIELQELDLEVEPPASHPLQGKLKPESKVKATEGDLEETMPEDKPSSTGVDINGMATEKAYVKLPSGVEIELVSKYYTAKELLEFTGDYLLWYAKTFYEKKRPLGLGD